MCLFGAEPVDTTNHFSSIRPRREIFAILHATLQGVYENDTLSAIRWILAYPKYMEGFVRARYV